MLIRGRTPQPIGRLRRVGEVSAESQKNRAGPTAACSASGAGRALPARPATRKEVAFVGRTCETLSVQSSRTNESFYHCKPLSSSEPQLQKTCPATVMSSECDVGASKAVVNGLAPGSNGQDKVIDGHMTAGCLMEEQRDGPEGELSIAEAICVCVNLGMFLL